MAAKSFSYSILFGMVLVAFVSIGLCGSAWIGSEYLRFRNEEAALRAEQVGKRKIMIKQQVDGVMDYIDYKRALGEERVRNSLKSRVLEAHAVASHMVEVFQGEVSGDDLQVMVIETLRPIRFNHGRGYYFTTRLDGVEQLFADRPEFENKNLLHIEDPDGKQVIRDMIQLVKSHNEGFYSYRWSKPDRRGKHFQKVAYVKHFSPFNWFIGTGEYIEDMEREVQAETIRRIEKISFEHDGFIFAGTWNKVSLTAAAKENDPERGVDTSGGNVVDQMIALSKKHGGYLTYTLPDIPDSRTASQPRISYVGGVPEWQWYISAHISLDSVEQAVATAKNTMVANIKRQCLLIFGLLVILLALAACIAFDTMRSSKRSFAVFLEFFRNAAKDRSAQIDVHSMDYTECQDMAVSVNRMMRDRKEAEDKLINTEQRQAVILSCMPMALYAAKPHGSYGRTWVSPQISRISGRAAEHFLDEPGLWFDRIHSDDRQRVQQELAKLEVSGKLSVDYRWQVENGVYRWFHDEAVLIRDIDGLPAELTGLWLDIEERRKMESDLRQAQKMEAIGTLAGGIAHDFNNILTVILGFSKIVSEGAQDRPQLLRDIGEVEKAGKRAQSLVRQILVFSRMHEGGEGQVFQMSLIVKEVSKMLRCSLPSSIEMKVNVASKAWVEADPTQVHQIVMNLCTNAYHAMRPGGGVLAVSLTDHELPGGAEEGGGAKGAGSACGYVCLSVRDTGKGMTPEVVEKIFEPYFTTKVQGEGTGLGLAVVHGVVKKCNGSIDVKSTPGEGSLFSVYLPTVESGYEHFAAAPLSKNDMAGCENILLVDDEPKIVAFCKKTLSRQGYNVTAFTDSGAALEEFIRRPESYDLVLTDVTMHKMTGLDLAKRINAIRPEIPIIICSGYSELIDHETALALGFSAYLEKPLIVDELTETVRNILDGGKFGGEPLSDTGRCG